MGRFDTYNLDTPGVEKMNAMKAKLQELEGLLNDVDVSLAAPGEPAPAMPRSKELAFQALEVAYGWIKAALRDEMVTQRPA